MGERLEGRQGDQFRDGEHNPSRRSGGSDQEDGAGDESEFGYIVKVERTVWVD